MLVLFQNFGKNQNFHIATVVFYLDEEHRVSLFGLDLFNGSDYSGHAHFRTADAIFKHRAIDDMIFDQWPKMAHRMFRNIEPEIFAFPI